MAVNPASSCDAIDCATYYATTNIVTTSLTLPTDHGRLQKKTDQQCTNGQCIVTDCCEVTPSCHVYNCPNGSIPNANAYGEDVETCCVADNGEGGDNSDNGASDGELPPCTLYECPDGFSHNTVPVELTRKPVASPMNLRSVQQPRYVKTL